MSPMTIRPAKVNGEKRRPMCVRFTVDRYLSLGRNGAFGDRRVELIEGEVYEMAPQDNPHAIMVERACETLRAAFGKGF